VICPYFLHNEKPESVQKTMERHIVGSIQPFLISLTGIITDHITTNIGLGLGFYETHPQYHPAIALIVFWSGLTLLTKTLPQKRLCNILKNIIASIAFLGTMNNTLVILGVFSGLTI